MFKHSKNFNDGVEIDIINDVLNLVLVARPDSSFVQSLLLQYRERGNLSKKQLEGLYQKAVQSKAVAPGKLATLEAVIIRMPNRYKSATPPPKPIFAKDEKAGALIDAILAKRPGHKRALFLQLKYNNNETLTTTEVAELEKFNKLL